MLQDFDGVKVGQVDCQAYGDLCGSENVNSYPTIRLYSKSEQGFSQFQYVTHVINCHKKSVS